VPLGVREVLLTKVPESEVDHWAAEAIAVAAAREHIISRRKAATLLGYEDYESREAFFEHHGLTNEYTVEMVEEDFGAIDALRTTNFHIHDSVVSAVRKRIQTHDAREETA
jgi:hypothetical protein